MNILKKYSGYEQSSRGGIICKIDRSYADFPLHRHDHYEFEFITAGRILHEVNGNCEELTAGSAFALSPADVHRFTVLEPVELHNVCIYYKDASLSLKKLLNRISFPLVGRLSKEDFLQVNKCFYGTIKECESGRDFAEEMMTANVTKFIINIFRGGQSIASKENNYDFVYVAKALEFIDKNISDSISLSKVANHVNLTPSYFSRLFTNIVGSGFLKYLTEARISRATDLLSTTELSILDIAYAVGFGSFSSFSRAFKTVCGCTPRKYRKPLK